MSKGISADSRRSLQGETHSRMGLGSPTPMCAFHHNQKITNFCTNRQCLLPLCPKCVKIHIEQHIKMGIFGEFDTIQESLGMADDGLKYTVQRLGQFQKLVIQMRQSYQSKIASEKKVLREAKNYFFEEIERIFDGYEKAMLAYEHSTYKQFFDELYQSQQLLTRLSQNSQKALKRLSLPQSMMEGIINYYSEIDEIEKIDILSQNLQRNFPDNLKIKFYTHQLERLQSTIKRYIDAGGVHQSIWRHYIQLFSKEQASSPLYSPSHRQPQQYKNEAVVTSSKRKSQRQQSPPRDSYQQKIQKSSLKGDFSRMNANTALDKFKSPLDNFSLSKMRRDRNQYE